MKGTGWQGRAAALAIFYPNGIGKTLGSGLRLRAATAAVEWRGVTGQSTIRECRLRVSTSPSAQSVPPPKSHRLSQTFSHQQLNGHLQVPRSRKIGETWGTPFAIRARVYDFFSMVNVVLVPCCLSLYSPWIDLPSFDTVMRNTPTIFPSRLSVSSIVSFPILLRDTIV